MWDWISSRPQRCLKFGTASIAWAETERNWHGRRRHRCVMAPVDDGMITPSPTEENVSDASALANRIRALISPDLRHRTGDGGLFSDFPRRIAVLLPDTAVSTTILHLEQLPTRDEERDALIRWRLGQEHLFPMNGAKMLFQVFHDRSREKGPMHTVLTVTIQESVLKQYESLCESVGLIPQEVSITSLQIFDLWRKTSKASPWQNRECLWVSISDRALTTIICRQGRLLLYRCKLLGSETADALTKADMLKKIVDECCASVEICQQQYPSAVVKEVVICADGETAAFREMIESDLGLSVEHLGWESINALGRVSRESHRGMPSLAAMAGVL